MTIKRIESKMRKHGYKCSRDMNTGRITVRQRNGFMHGFDSYREAYNYYFA